MPREVTRHRGLKLISHVRKESADVKHWTHDASQGIEQSLGRCWAVEFADVNQMQNRHRPVVQNLQTLCRLPAMGGFPGFS